MNVFRRAILILFLTSLILPSLVSAQTDDVYTFPSGVSFVIPAGSVEQAVAAGDPPQYVVADRMLIEVVEPAYLADLVDDTLDVSLTDVRDYLLGLVGYSDGKQRGNSFSETLADGREVEGFVFVNSEAIVQTVVAIRFSDGRVGALNIRSFEPLNDADQDVLRALALTFDVPGAGADAAHGMPQTYVYEESGAVFGYPDEYVLSNEDEPPVSITVDGEIFITMVDPALVGIPPGETMATVADFAARSTPIDAATFKPFDVGGREAVIASAPSGQFIQSMVLVRFSNDTVGILDIVSAGPLGGDRLEEVRAIAASFNSASADFSGVTRDEFEQAQDRFEEGMTFYDEGDYEAALDLLDQAVALDPSYTRAIYWRGATYQHLGRLEDALADFEQALENLPDQRQILKDISDLLALLDRVDEAADALQAYVDDPGDNEVTSDVPNLLAVYEQVAAGEYHSVFYFERARALHGMRRYEEALRDTQTMLDNEPMNSTAYALQGVILIDLDREPEAIDVLTKGLTVEETSLLFLQRGFAHQHNILNEPDSVIDSVHDFQCALLIDDDTITAAQRASAERAITITMIDSDDYAPITDVADCAA